MATALFSTTKPTQLNSKLKFDLKTSRHLSNYGTSTAFGKATKPNTFQSLLKITMMMVAVSLRATISYKR
ncbi:putative type III restriction enzyme, res subunit [Vibrio parahaemolyticus EKP-028]|nr:putative type III restriction enzyme, res subunit [Vibrio parahaemolyticus EKP-028]